MAITNLGSIGAPVQQEPPDLFHLDVLIRDPNRVVFEGKAVAVSSKNSVGPLDILPEHENFITLATGNITVWIDKHQKQEIKTEKAIIKAESNKIIIYIGVETLYAEPDFAKIQPLGPAKKT